jgi:hypothetical protein
MVVGVGVAVIKTTLSVGVGAAPTEFVGEGVPDGVDDGVEMLAKLKFTGAVSSADGIASVKQLLEFGPIDAGQEICEPEGTAIQRE